ncbi:MAG: MFS transporter [Myxococcales bacterium FL481]|nr:MAG: MFS transporter [Myxococcales bacterium FL481]
MSAGLLTRYLAAYRGLPRTVWLISAVALINRAGTMVVPFLSLYLQESRGLDGDAIGTLLFLFGAGAFIGSLLGGYAVDRIGTTVTMQASLIGVAAAFVGFSHAQTVWWLGLGAFAIGFVGDMFRPAVIAAITQHAAPHDTTRAIALCRVAVNAGMAAGPAIGGILAVHDYQLLFWGDAATSLAAAIALALWVPRAARSPSLESSPPAKRPRRFEIDPGFVAFLALNGVVALGFFQALFTMPLFLHEAYGYAEDAIGALLAVQAATIVGIEVWLVHRLRQRNAMLVFGWGALLSGVGLSLVGLSGAVWLIVTAMVVWSFGEMLALPFSASLVSEYAGPKRVGSYMGYYSAVFAIAMMAAPVVGLSIRDQWGWSALWLCTAASGVAVCIASMQLATRPRGPS